MHQLSHPGSNRPGFFRQQVRPAMVASAGRTCAQECSALRMCLGTLLAWVQGVRRGHVHSTTLHVCFVCRMFCQHYANMACPLVVCDWELCVCIGCPLVACLWGPLCMCCLAVARPWHFFLMGSSLCRVVWRTFGKGLPLVTGFCVVCVVHQ